MENETKNSCPVIAIVGRPNVGKSSLFNVILGRRQAIVHRESGVTRDRIMSVADWHGRRFNIIDTGGLGVYTGEKKNVSSWDIGIREQVEAAVETADIIFFVTDVTDGILPLDEEIAAELRGRDRKVFAVVGKCDNPALDVQALEFSALGFPDIYPVSSLHRLGVDSLLDSALGDFPFAEDNVSDSASSRLRIAVVGRPNVGKSSFLNRMLGEQRVMVSDEAGTTRDSVDVDFQLKFGDEYIPVSLIDTAGLRKKSKVSGAVERYSVMRAEATIKRADLVIFVVEASPDGLTAQDRHIGRLIVDMGKGCVIAANKWDLCAGHKGRDIIDTVRNTLPQLDFAPCVLTCALSGYNFQAVLDSVAALLERMQTTVPTSLLNRVLHDAFERSSPPVKGKSPLKFYYAAMLSARPPVFRLFVNDPSCCAENYRRYLVNVLRRNFDFTGLPVELDLKPRPKRIPSKRTFPAKHGVKRKPAAGKSRKSGRRK